MATELKNVISNPEEPNEQAQIAEVESLRPAALSGDIKAFNLLLPYTISSSLKVRIVVKSLIQECVEKSQTIRASYIRFVHSLNGLKGAGIKKAVENETVSDELENPYLLLDEYLQGALGGDEQSFELLRAVYEHGNHNIKLAALERLSQINRGKFAGIVMNMFTRDLAEA